MREVHYYIADDNTQFDNEESCVVYELSKMAEEVKNDLKVWDNYGDVIPLTEFNELDNAMFIQCNSLKGAKFLKKVRNEFCYVSSPYDNLLESEEVPLGSFYYSEGGWVNLADIITKYQGYCANMIVKKDKIF